MKNDYPILDIGNKNGYTDYLDFIKFNDLTAPIMKGYDQFNRAFFVLRAIITKSDGSTLKTMETFFQRYSDYEDVWHGCGHDGPYFLSTEGGIKLNQINFIKNLLENKKIDLTDELMDDIRFGDYLRSHDNTKPKLVKIELY
jgi:hypothetical protein